VVSLHLDEEEGDVKEKNMAEAAPAHARSEEAVNPALRAFKVPLTDISINAYRIVTIQPTTTGINAMEFIIPALDDYVELGRSYFTMELRSQIVPMITWQLLTNSGLPTIWLIPSSTD